MDPDGEFSAGYCNLWTKGEQFCLSLMSITQVTRSQYYTQPAKPEADDYIQVDI